MQPNGKVKALSTVAMIHDLVKTIGGDYVDSYTLIRGELDPHSYQLVKGDDETLAFADLIFFNGLGLEHGPSLQKYLLNSPKVVSLGDSIRKNDPSIILDQKGQIDPHIWMDIEIWRLTIPLIVQHLSQKDPLNADYYLKNGKKLDAELATTNQEIYDLLQAIPEKQRYLVTSHDAFNYFTRRYLATPEEALQGGWEKRFAAPEGLAPESQLSVSDIQQIVRHLKEHQIHVLFPESNVSKDSIRKIVQVGLEMGMSLQVACAVLYADAMGSPGSDADSYQKMVRHNAQVIADHLQNNVSLKSCP